MKTFFKNLGVIFIFIGIIPILVMFQERFKMETALISLFSFALGITLFILNKE